MGLILSLETSTPVCALAIHKEGELLMETALHLEKSHSRELPVQARQMMETTGFSFQDLTAVAVAGGPGSYTGLRIGTSFAKGICYANNIPLIGIGSLASMALKVRNMAGDDALYLAMMDARRMEVYMEVFNANMETMVPARPVLLEEYDFDALLEARKCYIFGNGSDKARDIITHPNARFIGDIHPGANEMGMLAWKRHEEGSWDDLAYFEPDYLKEFQATKPKKIF
jgi:tRNA threonylcarbamoyladenosine biosynthesis protein TsaB